MSFRIASSCFAILSCLTLSSAYAAEGPHWTYEGHGAPAEWGALSPDFAACERGHEQSPIDLHAAIPAMLADPVVQWEPTPLKILNNGHTIQVDVAPGSKMMLAGEEFSLAQFHFHHLSEHTVEGKHAQMEIHFVHKGASGLAVLGVLVEEGPANPLIAKIWDKMPKKEGAVTVPDAMISPQELLPAGDATAWRYAGSLTTPPCSEVVSWVVLHKPITMSAEQLAAFAALYPNNARPIQPLYRRQLLLRAS